MTSLPKQDFLFSQKINSNNSNNINRKRSETNTDDINFEPMSRLPDDKKPGSLPKKSESLTLRVSDETRVASAIYEASKKRKTGSIYSLSIQLSSNGTLGLGVKALKNNILVISMLKRVNGILGPGEAAGVRLGDIVVGVNFKPCRDGVRSLLSALNHATDNNETIVQLQCWRCHQLCSDSIPGSLFPRCDDILVQGYTLYRTKVFSDWERWNFIEIMLRHMKEELEFRIQSTGNALEVSNSYPKIRAIHNQLLDLERNILQAKGLRTALCVRIVHTSFVDDAVVYVLRIEDVESGRQWSVRRRYRDFFGLHGDLLRMSHYTQDIPFPKKKLVSLRTSSRIIEERIVALEQFIRMAIHRLTHYSTMDAHASQSLRRMQQFLDVGEFVDSLNPPPFDDQRYLELMVYRHLNDFNSLSCQQCIRFVDAVNLDSLVTTGNDGYQPVLTLLSQALLEVEEYTLQQFGQQMTQVLNDRRPDSNPEMIRVFVRRCVRRQVESAVYLPLRRAVFRIVYSFIAIKAQKLQQAIRVLKTAPTSLFFQGLDVESSEKLNPAISAFRDLVSAYLPADQSHALMQAAGAVMELHSDCIQRAKQQKLQKEKNSTESTLSTSTLSLSVTTSSSVSSQSSTQIPSPKYDSKDFEYNKNESTDINDIDIMTNMLNKSVLADPASTIFSAPEHVLTEKRNFDEHLKISNIDGEHQTSNNNEQFFGEKNAIRYSGVDLRKNKSPSPKKQINYERIDENLTDSNDVLLEGLLRQSVDSRSVSVDNYDKLVTIRGSSRLASGVSRQFSLDSTIWEHNIPISSQLLKDRSLLSSNDEIDENNLDEDEDDDNNNMNTYNKNHKNDNESDDIDDNGNNDNNDNNNNVNNALSNQLSSTQLSDLPDDLDDRIDVNADEQEEDLYPIRFTEVESNPLNDSMNQQNDSKDIVDPKNYTVVGADDFLPMFVYVLVRADLPQLILVKDIMTTLVDNEEMYGECGYYMATLEAAVQHIVHMADDYNSSLSQNN